MPHGDYSAVYSHRRPCPVPLLPPDKLRRTSEGDGSSPKVAELDYVIMEREIRAKEIIAESKVQFQKLEEERRAREVWLEQQARLTEAMTKRYHADEEDGSEEDEEDPDLLAYCPSTVKWVTSDEVA